MAAELDLRAVQQWFDMLYGELDRDQLINIVCTGNWVGEYVPAGLAPEDAAELISVVLGHDAEEPEGIYSRVTTITERPGPGKRGGLEISTRLPGFWADIDVAGPGHKSKGTLPPTKKDAVRIVDNSCLPEPTVWVDSGGGLYPWWLLEEPYAITEENLSAVMRLSDDIQTELQRSARELGYEYAPMGDLARVLRVPGTVNRKVPGEEKVCKVIRDGGPRHTMQGLRDITPVASRKVVTPSAGNRDLQKVLEGLPGGEPCLAMAKKIQGLSDALRTAETGGRHNAGLSVIGSVLWMGNVGHAGAVKALEALEEVFNEIKPESPEGEWDDMVDYVLERMEVIEDRHCCGEMSFSDSHLSLRVTRELLKGMYLWSRGTGWMRWTGTLWGPVTDAHMAKVVMDWLLENFKDAVGMLQHGDAEKVQKIVKEWRAAMSTNRVNGLVSLSRGRLEFDPAEMDADPDILNTPTGVVHLPTGEVFPHDSKRLVSKITVVGYDPKAQSEAFDRILGAVPEYALEWFQVKVGQAATGYPQIGDDPNVITKGTGMNGKTTVLNALKTALGTYSAKVPKVVLTGDRSTNEVMELKGTRFALTEELPEGATLNTVALKEITDTEEMQGRHLYKDLVTWEPTHTMFVSTNILPQVNETTWAVWRRLVLMDFPYTYVSENRPLEPHERRADLELRIRAKERDPEIMAAALRWIVDGARAFYAAGRRCREIPEEMVRATREWRKQTDVILSYWDEGRIEADPGSCIDVNDLHADVSEWMTGRGNRPISMKVLNPMFAEHQQTMANRVTRERPLRLPTGVVLSRPKDASGVPSQRPTVWMGVRFVQQDEAVSVAADDDPFATSA